MAQISLKIGSQTPSAAQNTLPYSNEAIFKGPQDQLRHHQSQASIPTPSSEKRTSKEKMSPSKSPSKALSEKSVPDSGSLDKLQDVQDLPSDDNSPDKSVDNKPADKASLDDKGATDAKPSPDSKDKHLADDNLKGPTGAKPSPDTKGKPPAGDKAPTDVKPSPGFDQASDKAPGDADKSTPKPEGLPDSNSVEKTSDVKKGKPVDGMPSSEKKESQPPLKPPTDSRRSRMAAKSKGDESSSRPKMSNASSYPRPVFTLIQNMLPRMGMNLAYTGESEMFMLWNAILNTHFPADMGYGVSFHPSHPDDGTNFLIVKLIQDRLESTVLVLGFKKPGDDTAKGREMVEKATADYVIGPGFDDTDFTDIYTVNSVGLSWAGSKLEEPKTDQYECGDEQPETIVDWTTNMTSALSFDKMRMIASKINNMTQKKAEKTFSVS